MVERNRIINEDCIVGLKDLLRGGGVCGLYYHRPTVFERIPNKPPAR